MAKSFNENVYYSIHTIDSFRFFLASTGKGLCMCNFIGNYYRENLYELRKFYSLDNIIENDEKNIEAFIQLKDYFKGNRRDFDLKLDLKGTSFQKKVWHILTKVNFGEVVTYKDIALELGDVKKSRPVGGAVSKNPLVIIVPCHRVIGSNGKLTGFSAPGGISLKKRLLKLEKSFSNC